MLLAPLIFHAVPFSLFLWWPGGEWCISIIGVIRSLTSPVIQQKVYSNTGSYSQSYYSGRVHRVMSAHRACHHVPQSKVSLTQRNFSNLFPPSQHQRNCELGVHTKFIPTRDSSVLEQGLVK